MLTLRIIAWHPEKAWGSACGADKLLLVNRLRPALVQRGTEVKRIAPRILKKELLSLEVKDSKAARSIIGYLTPFGAELEVDGKAQFDEPNRIHRFRTTGPGNETV